MVLLAGGACAPELAAVAGATTRAELPVGDERMIDIVLRAVSPLADPIVVGGPSGIAPRQVEAGATFLASLRAGLGQVHAPRFLIATVDLPLLTEEALRDFLERCDPAALLNYAVVPKDIAEAALPGTRRTSLRVREGEFTGGNVALVDAELMRRALPTLERAYAARKSPLRLAGIVGFGTLLRVAMGKLVPGAASLASLEKAVGRFLGGRVKAVQSNYAGIGADVDDVQQYRALVGL